MDPHATENSLRSLKEELESSWQRLQFDLESYLEDPGKLTALTSVAQITDRIASAFASTGQTDAASLAEQTAALARDLAGGEVEPSAREQKIHILLIAVLQLPQYLEWLQRGSRQSFKLLPLINRIRALRGLEPVSKSKLPAFLTVSENELFEPGLRELAVQLRPLLQRALLGLLRGQVNESLSQITSIFSRFKQAAANETSYHFWWLAEGLLRELQKGTVPEGREIKLVLRDLDGQIKYLLESGKMFSGEAAAEALSQKLIDYLSSSSSGLARLQNRTDYNPPQLGQLLASRDLQLLAMPPDVESLLRICDALKETLALTKDAVDRFGRDSLHQTSGLRAELERLQEVRNVLTILNMAVPASVISRHLKVLQQWLEGNSEITDEQISQLAGELILVEESLEGVGEFVYNQKLAALVDRSLDDSARVALLRDFQRQQARLALTRETVSVLCAVRDSAIAFSGSKDEASRQDWQSEVHRVGGIFAVLECDRAAALVQRLANSIQDFVTDAAVVNDPVSFTSGLNEIVMTLEYYLELLGEAKKPEDDILNYAEDQLDRLAGLGAAAQKRVTKPVGTDSAEPEREFSDIIGLPEKADLPAESAARQAPQSGSAGDGVRQAPAAAAHPSSMPPASAGGVDPEFLEVFFEEAQEELASIRKQLAVWEGNLADKEALSSIRRSFHTLKGSGRMVEQFTISEFSWCFENLLNGVLEGGVAASKVIGLIDEAVEALAPVVANAGLSNNTIAANQAALTERAGAILRGEAWPESEPVTVKVKEEPAIEPPSIAFAVAEQEEPGSAVKPVAEVAEELESAAIAASMSEVPTVPGLIQQLPATAEVDRELIEVFQYEAAEILDTSDILLERWSNEQDNDELLNDLRREMHTLKGSSRMAGFLVIGDLAHAMESVLDAMATHRSRNMPAMVSTLQGALDRLNEMLAGVRSGAEILPADELITVLKELLTAKEARETTRPPRQEVLASPIESDSEPSTDVAVAPVTEKLAGGGDPELIEAFLYEAAEILDASDVTLQGWRNDLDNIEALNNLRREVHTLKGGSRMAGFPAIGDLAHAMESVLDALGKGSLSASTRVIDSLQRALDKLNDMVAQVQGGSGPNPAGDLINDLKDLLGEAPEQKPAVTALPTPGTRLAEKTPVTASEDTIRVSATLLNTLVNEMGESSIFRARIDQGLGGLRFNLSELNQTVFRLRQQLRRLEIETETQILSRYEESGKDHRKDFDPLELDRFSELQQLSRSLMESVDDLSNIESVLEEQAQEMSFLLEQQGRVNKEVQQGLMQTRMVRFSSIVPRLRRVVRQAAQELGKRAELVLEGSESEVDRAVLDNMVAPLEHMLRNALSHGIEEPERRLADGKPETGTITLTLRREGAELVLNMSDDGAGLNFEAIRAKGEANGMLIPGKPVTEDELIALLLRPGFSTATKVTQISGRGVGMDVLNDAIKSMRGTLLIQSQPGQGTYFTIRLPFSLAVTQALLVRVGSHTYAVPLLSIESVVRLGENDLPAYLSGKAVEYKYGNYRYPLHNLGLLLGIRDSAADESSADKRPPALLFRSAEASAALQVEAVLGNQEIIVKPVAPQFQAVSGVSGATVLADGRVVVVLDLAALVRNLAVQARKQAEAAVLTAARRQSRSRRIRALVIDDSITMRKVTCRFLERHNISATAAKDGVEAVAKLEESVPPDLVILDIEMPRMDGFEVAAHIRNQAHLKHLPIIMVTSRGGEKHRQRAAKLGVTAYLTKPYQEEEMLKTIREVLGEQALEDLELTLPRF